MAILENNNFNNRFRLHHIGLLVDQMESYLTTSFWSRQSSIVYDPNQQARLCLVCIGEDKDRLVELIEPVGKDSPTYQALDKGQKLHHLCFEAPDTEAVDTLIEEYRLLPVTEWQRAVLFQGRPVRFAFTRNRELVEFVADG